MVSKKIHATTEILTGLMMLTTVLLGYFPQPEIMYEFTCISNTLCSIILLTDGILRYQNKQVPALIWQCALSCMCTVAITIAFELSGYHFFNFSGAFLFLHGVNPVIVIVLYIIANPKPMRHHYFVAPICVMAYALFDIVRFAITGKLVYDLVAPEILNIWSVLLIGTGLYAVEVAIVYGISKLTQCTHE